MVALAPILFVLGIGLNNLFTTDACNGCGLILGFNKIVLAAPLGIGSDRCCEKKLGQVAYVVKLSGRTQDELKYKTVCHFLTLNFIVSCCMKIGNL